MGIHRSRSCETATVYGMNDPESSSIWHLVGNGAIGSALASRLAGEGESVHLAGRDSGSNTLTLTYEEPHCSTKTIQCPASIEPHSPVERLVIATKAFSVAEALSVWAPALTPNSRVYFLQNGLGFIPEGVLPADVYSLTVVNSGFAAYLKSPGHVVQTAMGRFWVGDESGSPTPPSEDIAEDLRILHAANFLCDWTPDIAKHRWLKICTNAVINAQTVLFDCPNGELSTRPEAIELTSSMCDEFGAAFRAMGIDITAEDIRTSTQHVIELTAENLSSMLQDYRHGRRANELAFINGTIIEAARSSGISMPVNADVYHRAGKRFESLNHLGG